MLNIKLMFWGENFLIIFIPKLMDSCLTGARNLMLVRSYISYTWNKSIETSQRDRKKNKIKSQIHNDSQIHINLIIINYQHCSNSIGERACTRAPIWDFWSPSATKTLFVLKNDFDLSSKFKIFEILIFFTKI